MLWNELKIVMGFRIMTQEDIDYLKEVFKESQTQSMRANDPDLDSYVRLLCRASIYNYHTNTWCEGWFEVVDIAGDNLASIANNSDKNLATANLDDFMVCLEFKKPKRV